MIKKTTVIIWLIISVFTNGFPQERKSLYNKTSTRNKNIKQPNIVFIIAESHRAEALGIAGNPFVQTPNLDNLVQRGVMFNNAYVTTAICAVSRASILSGQHRLRHGINDFKTNFTDQAFRQTFPMILKANGYATASIGSYGVGNVPHKESYDYWAVDIPRMLKGLHNTDNIVNQANVWLDNYHDERPFYMYLGFNSAHEVDPTANKPAHYIVQKRHKSLYQDITIPKPETASKQYWNSFPDFFRTDQNIARKRWYGFLSSDDLFQKNAKDYYRSITGLDEAVGSIIKKLKELNLADNTIIVYTSDHGFSLGEHGLMGKWYGYDVGIHVPLIIYDPRDKSLSGVKNSSIALNIDLAPTILSMAGVKNSSIALNIDLAPTILSMAGVAPQKQMQGMNLVELVKGKIAERESFFYEHTVFASPILPKVEGVVTKSTKYMKYIEHDYETLFDLTKDPDEKVNVAQIPIYKNALAKMRQLYVTEKASAK